jgi:FAD/FMN-containing dehydrogenase
MGMTTGARTQRVVMEAAVLDELRTRFRGELLQPGDEGYDRARAIWNGAIDKHPALIARCTGVADVIAAVRFARAGGLPVAVRGGGHNVAGTAVCDAGLVVDLSPMKGMRVDPATRTARAEPGLLWGEFDRETQAFGLAAPGGIVTHTGIAGLTLGGGIGWLMRKHGLTCDNLRSADVVTADGEFVSTSATDNPDLFWGIRGGGGNFGIITSFEFQLHPVGPTVLAGPVFHPARRATEVLRFYREFARSIPDELTTILSLRHAPAVPFLPAHLHGEPVIGIIVCYAGPVEDGERVIEPLRGYGPPLIDLISPTAYTAHQGLFDATVPHGLRYYWKSDYLPDLTDGAIDALAARAWTAPSPHSYTIIFQLGGTIHRGGEHDMAFSNRDARFAVNINSIWTNPNKPEPHIEWARMCWEGLHPHSTGGVYMNFLGNEGEERVRAAYGAQKFERLVALKNKYDPTNLFRLNQNIKPTV